MTKKNLPSRALFVCTVVALMLLTRWCPAAEIEPRNQRLADQQQRLKDIEQLITRERQRIENWYEFRVNEVLEREEIFLERVAEGLLPTERLLLTQFIKISKSSYPDSFITSDIGFSSGMTQTFFTDDPVFNRLLPAIVNSYPYPTEESIRMEKKANRVLDAMDEFESELIRLESLREIKLAELENLEKELKESVFAAIDYIKSLPQTPQLGVVSAISYSDKDAFCMIDGIDREIIRAGTEINRVKIVEIQRYAVKFEKKGRRWVQKIGEKANSAWTKPF